MRTIRRPLLFLAGLFAASLWCAASDAACDAPGRAAPTEIPAPDDLERKGVRIGLIEIDVGNIFDPATPGEDAAVYRMANSLHVSTRDDAIRSQLLFSENELYSRQRIAESERLLRGRRYLYDARVDAVCYHPDDETLDLIVHVRDVWSLNPGFSFNRKGGTNRMGFEIEDQDFLGRGEMVSIGWGRNVDRDSLRFVYQDPQILSSWWRGRLEYSDNSDGQFGHVDLARPFYSLDTRWSAGTAVTLGDRIDPRYQRGQVLDRFAERTDRIDLYGGLSAGLRDGWTRRWLAGIRLDRSRFSLAPGEPLVAGLPQDRELIYPWVGAEWLEDNFVTTRNQDQLARTEDLQLGRVLHAELGLAAPAWGADRTAGLFTLHAGDGRQFDESQSMFVSCDLDGRLETDGLRDTALQAEARYYNRQQAHALFFASARGAAVQKPDLDHQLLLGGDNGLRGYPLRYQSGTSSVLFTAEERFYTDWYPFHLFHIGAAMFADAGRTWGRDVAGEEPLGWLSDVGVGLRIGNARSGLGNVLHVDLAVPTSGRNGIDAVQLLVETRQSF